MVFLGGSEKPKLPEIRICGSLRPFAGVLRAICGGFAGIFGRGFSLNLTI